MPRTPWSLIVVWVLLWSAILGGLPQAVYADQAEYVVVTAVNDLTSKVIVERRNGGNYLIEYGVGCLSLSRYVGKSVVINSPGLFGGVGSQLLIPEQEQACRIWNSSELKSGSLPSQPAVAPSVSQYQSLIRTAAFVSGTQQYIVAQGDSKQTFHMDVAPFLSDGRAYVPVRYLAYAMGISDDGIAWVPSEQSVTLRLGTTTVGLVVGKAEINVSGQSARTIDAAPILRDGRVFLPARAVAEAFGYTVAWDEQYQAVVISKNLACDYIRKLMDEQQQQVVKDLAARGVAASGTFLSMFKSQSAALLVQYGCSP